MSAFLCSDKHISALVNAGVQYDMRYPADSARHLFDLLLKENLASLADRYGERSEEAKSAKRLHRYMPGPALDPLSTIKLAQSYQYQSCEHMAWDESLAKKWTDALIHSMTCLIPGYDAAPWSV